MTPPRAVALVGMSCRYPGGANSPEALWEMLASGRNAIGEMPPGRFDIQRLVGQPREPGKVATPRGGFLDGIDLFDAGFFGISPREAEKVDPQHRILLELTWEALEDAAIVPKALTGTRAGVYVGLWSGEYESVVARQAEEIDLYATTGGGRYAAAGRISYALDLRGPSLTLDTACSSSLVALHIGAQAIRQGEIEVAIAGAANLILQPYVSIGYSRSGMLSPGAQCRFGAPAPDGYVRSEGAGVVVLKSLEAAKRDGDMIHAVVLGSAVNSDGRASGRLVAPSDVAQAEMLRTAYEQAGVSPSSVRYVEAHGTGTAAGDRVELTALSDVLGRGREGRALPVGSIKGAIGHTEAASGVAGVIKAVLALRHGRVYSETVSTERNPEIPWDELGVEVIAETTDLDADPGPLVVGVNSFGVTGTNAHVVLARPDETRRVEDASSRPEPRVVAVSARSEDALVASARALLERISGDDPPSLDALSYTTTCRRQHHAVRAAAVVEDVEELSEALEEVIEREVGLAVEGVVPDGRAPRIAFVFSGQGSQWVGMGRTLMNRGPAFAEAIREAAAELEPLVDWSLEAVLAGDHPLDAIDVIQPTLAVVQIALARQLMAWGVDPVAMLGHSMGEVAAAQAAGALSMADAMLVLATRSRLLHEIAGQGAMALADEEPSRLEARLERFGGRVSVAAFNGPRSTVLSGDPNAVDELVHELEAEGVFCRRVRVDVASHSAQTDPLLPPLHAALEGLAPREGKVPFHSTVRAAPVDGATLDAEYWTANLRQPVRLHETLTGLIADGVDAFVEVSPHPVLFSSIRDVTAGGEHRPAVVALLRREEPEMPRALDALARLHVVGAPIDWSALAPEGAAPTALPPYPWQRERYWLSDWDDWSGRSPTRQKARLPSEVGDALYEVKWIEAPASDSERGARRWRIIGATDTLHAALSAEIERVGGIVATSAAADVVLDVRALGGTVSRLGSLDEAIRVSCEGALELARDLAASSIPEEGCWWITRGAMGTDDRPPTLDAVGQSSLWGVVRSLWEEHAELKAHVVDLDPDADEPAAARAIVESVLRYADEGQLAFVGDRAFAPRLQQTEASEVTAQPSWRADATYWITGGLGDLGLRAAEEMVHTGARHLVLMSRTPLPPREDWGRPDLGDPLRSRIDRVVELEAMGASVHTAAVDVADPSALRTLFDRQAAERRPEIGGVVHCAGTLDNHLLSDMTWDQFMAPVRGKAVGAWNLHTLLPDVERTVFFSSVVPVLPEPGQANYAAANAVLDALARARSASGSPTVSLGWGVWRDAGMVRDDQVTRYVRIMEERGSGSLEPTAAQTAFGVLASSSRPHIVVAPIDWSRAAPRLRAQPGSRFYSLETEGADAKTGSLRDDLSSVAPGEQQHALVDRLRSHVGRILSLPPSKVAPGQPLGRQGLDSLMAMELRGRIERDLDLSLPASAVWNYPTLDGLSAYLLGRLGLGPDPSVHDTTGDGTTTASGSDVDMSELVAEVSSASEEDILRLLREGG